MAGARTPERMVSPAGTGTVLPSPPPLRRVEHGGRSGVCSVESRHRSCSSSITERSKVVDLSHLPDNEFFLISPNALPQPPSAFFLTSEDTSSSDDEAMEVEAITSSSSRNTAFRSLAQGNRSRSVTMGTAEDARSMYPFSVASRFRIPGLALQPRGKSAQTPWQSMHNPSTW